MPHRTMLVFLVGIGLLGIALLGGGITGMAVLDPAPLCEIDNECGEQMCCLFYGKSAGVCGEPAACQNIAEMTREEFEQPSVLEEKLKNTQIVNAVLGLFITLLAIIASHHYLTHHKPKKARS